MNNFIEVVHVVQVRNRRRKLQCLISHLAYMYSRLRISRVSIVVARLIVLITIHN